jgi:hypothetical protein
MYSIAMEAATVEIVHWDRWSLRLPASLFYEDLGHKIPLRAGVEKSLRLLPAILSQHLNWQNKTAAL